MRYREILFEMSSLKPQETGLPFAVWVSHRGRAKHDVRIKVTLPPWGANPEAIYSLRPFAWFEGDRWLSASQEADLAAWAKLNINTLVDFWNGRIIYDDELREKLISLGDAPPKDYREAVGALRISAPKVQAIYWFEGAYHLVFNKFAPSQAKILQRFSVHFPQPIHLHLTKPSQGIELWPRRGQ